MTLDKVRTRTNLYVCVAIPRFFEGRDIAS